MSKADFKANITIYLMEHKFGKIDSKEVLEAITYEAQAYADQEHQRKLKERTFKCWIEEVINIDGAFAFMLDGYQTGEIIEWVDWFMEGITPHEAIKKHYHLYQ